MRGATTKENAPLERGNFSATTTKHIAEHSADRDENKAFSTWQAKYALLGHSLYRTAGADGSILYLAGKWTYFKELKNLEAVAAFLALIGGAR